MEENIEKIKGMFPNCVVESKDSNGVLSRMIDFDALKQELSPYIVNGVDERYQMLWPDKKQAIMNANAAISLTMRPCKEKSVNFENARNIYIEGDNLDALKLLRETYLHRFDVIYIDPPYNTGNNLIYKNDFHKKIEDYLQNSGQFDEDGNMLVRNVRTNGRFHTDWLNMIYPRLKVAKDLLSDDGIIVVTIDDYEVETLTMVLNEIFGEENHLATIVIKNNPSGRSTVTGASISHEYALFYGSNTDVHLHRLPRNDKQISRYKESDDFGKFEWVNFRKHGGYKEDAPTMYYPIYIKKDGSSFRIPKIKWIDEKKAYDILEEKLENEIISYPIDENGRPRRWKWSLDRALKEMNNMAVRLDRNNQPAVYIKSYMNDEGMLPLTVWDDKKYSSTEYGTNLLIEVLGGKYFDYPKSLYAVMDCIRIASENPNALILDFFSGSATTAHAVMQLNEEDGGNRKFVLVQLPEPCDKDSEAFKNGFKTICDLGEERIKKVGKQLKNTDASFRVFKIDSSNMKDTYYRPVDYSINLLDQLDENIKPDRTPEDLVYQVMLDLGMMLDSKIEEKNINNKKVFIVGEYNEMVAPDLICCFDNGIDNDTVTEIAKMKPRFSVFRDKSLGKDSVAVNFDQIFETYSPSTTRKVL